MSATTDPASQIVKIMSIIYNKLMTSSSGGNISVTDNDGNIWITPAAKDKADLSGTDICCVKTNGEIDGTYLPSSELPFHKEIYKVRKDIKAIVHAHSTKLVAYSTRKKTPDTKALLSSYDICGKVGIAGYEKTGSKELAINIADEFKKGAQSVIMENHGAVVAGKNLYDAFERFESFEYLAQSILGALTIDKPIYLSQKQISKAKCLVQIIDSQKPGTLYKNKIGEYCKFAKRAHSKGLLTNRHASLSLRLGTDSWLFSNPDVPFWDLSANDLFINKITGTKDKVVFANDIHSLIYKKNPNIKSIIIAQPPAIMSFAISTLKLDVRNIPESLILLKEIPVIAYDSFVENPFQLAEIFSKGFSSAMIRNHSIIVTGSSIHESFNRLEVAEFTAKSIIAGNKLGKVLPIL